jgi:hypothetical protein
MSPRVSLLLVLAFSLPLSAEVAGNVARVLPASSLTRGTATNEVKAADPVDWNDILRTNKQGRMRVNLTDGSLLSLGSESEMRVVKHDPTSQQSQAELLYGRVRVKVVQMTKPSAGFEIRTPTAVVGAIGTELAIDAARASVPTSITAVTLEDLPSGALPGTPGQRSIADFLDVEQTTVYGLERIAGVRNIDPAVLGIVYLLPGEYTIVRRGQPPTPPRPFESGPLPIGSGPFDMFPECPDRALDLSRLASDGTNGIQYQVTGLGTSTGDSLQLRVHNPTPCPIDVFIPNGAVLKPKELLGNVVGTLADGGRPGSKDFQLMMTEGTTVEVPPSSPSPAGGMHFVAPESSDVTLKLRAHCLEKRKLAPEPNTSYQFAPPNEHAAMAKNRRLISQAYYLFLMGQARPKLVNLDSLIQWSIWASEEKMSEKELRELFVKLVEKNLKAEKKWDKEAKQRAEAAAADLGQNVFKVLAATH